MAQLYNYLMKQENILSPSKISSIDQRTTSKRYNELFFISNQIKNDPLMAYYDLQKLLIENKIAIDKVDYQEKNNYTHYVYLLEKIHSLLTNTKLIKDILVYSNEYSNSLSTGTIRERTPIRFDNDDGQRSQSD